jgi:hypothetical protein
MDEQVREALREAARLIKAGDKGAAQQILAALTRDDPYNADGWYLASMTVDTPERKIQLLERALTANPDHPQARDLLAIARKEAARRTQTATMPAAPSQPKKPRPAAKKANRRTILLLVGGGVALLVVLVAVGLVLFTNRQAEIERALTEGTDIAIPTLRPSATLEPSATTGPSSTPTATATGTDTATPTATPTAPPFGQTATLQRNLQQTEQAGLRLTGTAAAGQ